jgi:hypothetical protein
MAFHLLGVSKSQKPQNSPQPSKKMQNAKVQRFCMAIFFGKLWLLGALQIARCGTYLDEPPGAASRDELNSLIISQAVPFRGCSCKYHKLYSDLAMDNRYGIPSSRGRCEFLAQIQMGVSQNRGTPQNPGNLTILVLKPMVYGILGIPHFGKPIAINLLPH